MKRFITRAQTIVCAHQTTIILAALIVLTGVVSMAPAHLFAQMPDFGAATSAVQTKFKPLVIFIRFAAAAAAAAMAIKELFGAVKENKVEKYGAFFGLLIIAGILVDPSAFFTLFGLQATYTEIAKFGF